MQYSLLDVGTILPSAGMPTPSGRSDLLRICSFLPDAAMVTARCWSRSASIEQNRANIEQVTFRM
jgi:hypothetical protein